MGLDEINQLGELGAGAILGIVAVLLAWALLKFMGRESNRDKQEAAERAQDAETERLRLEERKLYMAWLGEMTKAAAETGNYIKALSEQQQARFDQAARTMAEVTARRDTEYKEGVDNIRADIDVVPGKVGRVTEPQIDTIRKALQELEERVGKRIDESVNKFTEENQAIIRAEIEALTNQLLRKFDELTEVVPEKVSRIITDNGKPQPAAAPQPVEASEPQHEGADTAGKAQEG